MKNKENQEMYHFMKKGITGRPGQDVKTGH